MFDVSGAGAKRLRRENIGSGIIVEPRIMSRIVTSDENQDPRGIVSTQTGIIDPAEAKPLILAGNAYFTLRSKVTGVRYTYRVYMSKKARARGELIYYVNMLYGRDNNSDYKYIGGIYSDAGFKHDARNSTLTKEAPSVIAFDWFWRRVIKDKNEKACELIEVWHAGRCMRCGKLLTDPISISAGMGPDCRNSMIYVSLNEKMFNL